jgi:pSer/pThr/pTyr-binding forkhead associated (FHA) protein
MKCKACGAENQDGGRFCVECGKSLGTIPKTVVEQSIKDEVKSKPRVHTSGETNLYGAQVVTEQKKARLVSVSSSGSKEVFNLDTDKTIIGRTSGDIQFKDDNFLSKEHACVTRRDGCFYISDLDSRNGTFVKVNGEYELKQGDTVLVGRQLFRLEVE